MAASRPLISPIEAVFLLILGAVAGLALGTVFMETADTIFSRGAELHYAEAHRTTAGCQVVVGVGGMSTGNQCTTVPKAGAGQVQDRSLLSAWSQRLVDRNCNLALNLQRAGEASWHPAELC
ncbi:hypothetical protein HaLaN_10833 [Haematococcus lacustris]|uniref:Uncharacterized protein n=1 Tax=Haematococcus lacustris TaxID=44745 RepID=A0A699YWW0_HAELA|nr:hypothetical protein HaLaN_10833 [Haematococcus lacustris]